MNEDEAPAQIVVSHQALIPIRDVPGMLPPRPNGKRLHISACYRWMTRGIRGVRLEVVRIGGSTYTSHEALARFAAALSPAERATTPVAFSKNRQQQIEHAASRLKALIE